MSPAVATKRADIPPDGRTAPQTHKSQPPKAIHVSHSNGNGNGHGRKAGEPAIAVAELDELALEPAPVELHPAATAVEVEEALLASVQTAAERRALAAAQLSAVLGTVRHEHDAALALSRHVPGVRPGATAARGVPEVRQLRLGRLLKNPGHTTQNPTGSQK